MGRLDGKAAIITSGEGSIGMATARAFAAEGASVFLAGISEPDLKNGAAELGGSAAWKVTDVTDSAQ
ncbi:SDR family NAD(P)-dependent oxidoreductase, partial [Trebonia sp.]|uniref:SDR family NAD(P)-dependent oxidoreductase n=1 Tax=Trebonia sp. TaxID=2767075 RepID=UPI00261B3CB9